MPRTLLFSITILFYAIICEVSAKNGIEVDVLVSQSETDNYIPVFNAEKSEFQFNSSKTEAIPADECKCKNGRCMRACDIENTKPCVNNTMLCVCNPGFSKVSNSECKYCDCRENFNCTFVKGSIENYKVCHCPKGYYEGEDKNLQSYCKAECNDAVPCHNGGTCHSKRCMCPRGTRGESCEEILECSACIDKLEADCLYNRSTETSYCSCKNSSLFFDYEKNTCIECPCENGDCYYETLKSGKRKLLCDCHSGYRIFAGYCKKCQCDRLATDPCKFDYDGEMICKCQGGFFERNGHCEICGCTMYSDLDTKCEMVGNMKRCYCKEGYQDITGHCEDINECETNNTCHPSSTCLNTDGSFECLCPLGYVGPNGGSIQPGEVCEDINECKETPTLCSAFDHMNCINLPGTYKCECCRGFQPSSYLDEPQKTTCVITKTHWKVPAIILIVLILALVVVSALVIRHVRNRAHSVKTPRPIGVFVLN